MEITVIVATHLDYPMPDDPLYLPVQAGAAIHNPLPYIPDNTGDNISKKNETFCELTCLYWAWKNLDADYIGLCHYRRYFSGDGFGLVPRVRGKFHRSGEISRIFKRVLTLNQAEVLLRDVPILLPRKRHYFIETAYSQYVHAHRAQDLEMTGRILAERYPDYLDAFERCTGRTSLHIANMFIMRKDLLDAYCTWLFDVLFELEQRLDLTDYSASERRVFGYVSERLLDVWLEKNQLPYRELPVIHTEPQHWLRKGTAFLRRKYAR